MKVKHINSGQVYETSRQEFYDSIESKGNAFKFEIIDDDSPIEIKAIRQKKAELLNETIIVKAKNKK